MLRLTNQELPIKTNIPRMACQEYYVKSVKRGMQKVVCQESHARSCIQFFEKPGPGPRRDLRLKFLTNQDQPEIQDFIF